MSDPITWLPGAERFDGNPTATVALDRARWEALGATFVEVDDGDDETPGLAIGQVDGLDFGVLDYGEGETYLLVHGPASAALEATKDLLPALVQAKAIEQADVVDTTTARANTTLEALDRRLAALEAAFALSAGVDAERPSPRETGEASTIGRRRARWWEDRSTADPADVAPAEPRRRPGKV